MNPANVNAPDWRKEREEIIRAVAALEHASRDDDRKIIHRRNCESAADGLSVMLGCYDVLMLHREQVVAERDALRRELAASAALIARDTATIANLRDAAQSLCDSLGAQPMLHGFEVIRDYHALRAALTNCVRLLDANAGDTP